MQQRRVHVLHVTSSWENPGGTENLVTQTVSQMRDDYGISSSIVGQANKCGLPAPELSAGPTDWVEFPTSGRGAPDLRKLARGMGNLRRFVAQVDPWVVHIHSTSSMAVAAAVVARSLGIPCVIHVHGEPSPSTPHGLLELLKIEPFVIAVSRAVSRAVVRASGRGVPPLVVANGIKDPSVVGTSSTDLQPRIALVGRLAWEKGFAPGLKAVAPLIRDFPALRVDVAGDGPQKPALQSLVDRLGIQAHVRFHGRVSHDRALMLIRESSLVLIPSVAAEGFSLVAAEAGLLERPVVAFDVGGLSETVSHGHSGILVRAGDLPALTATIGELLGDPHRRRGMGKWARYRALSEFSLDRFAADLLGVYESATGRMWRGEIGGAS